jgi:hypothetical protein
MYSIWKWGMVKKSAETNVLAWLWRKVRQVCEGGLRCRSMYFGHTGLADGDAQFEQLTTDVGRAPHRVVAAHLPDQITNFTGNRRSTWFAVARFPGPEQLGTFRCGTSPAPETDPS